MIRFSFRACLVALVICCASTAEAELERGLQSASAEKGKMGFECDVLKIRRDAVAERRDECSRGIYPTDRKFSELWRHGVTLEDEGQRSSESDVFKRRAATQRLADFHRGLKATATFGRSLCDLEGISERCSETSLVEILGLSPDSLLHQKVKPPLLASANLDASVWNLAAAGQILKRTEVRAPKVPRLLVVRNLNDGGPGSLRDAIDRASAGDIVLLGIRGSIVLKNGPLLIKTDLTILGLSPALTGVDGNRQSSVFEIERNTVVTIDRIAIKNGYDAAQNASASGGGIKNFGQLTMTDCLLAGNNTEFGFGGGIANVQEQSGDVVVLKLRRCVLREGHGIAGGGVFNGLGARLEATDTAFEDNVAPPYSTGGVFNQGSALLSRSLIAATSSRSRGLENSGDMRVINCTIIGHQLDSGRGGGILNSGNLTLDSATITRNSARSHGGGIHNEGVVTIKNTIIAGNGDPAFFSDSPDCSGLIASDGFNLIGDNSGATIEAVPGDHIGTADSPIDARLGPLADNGGFTKTCALLPGSPALNQGDCSDSEGNPVVTDQRGVQRGQGGQCDIGAFEARSIGRFHQ